MFRRNAILYQRSDMSLFLLLSSLVTVTLGKVPIDIYWNSTNLMFHDEGIPVVEVNRDTLPFEYDQVNIICPSGENVTERHIIYSVSEEEFDECVISSRKPRIIAVCDQPNNFMYFTITFRSFSPSPQQMEFKPGESYFFMSTATEWNIHHKAGGYCVSDNMRMVFRVAESKLETSPSHLLQSKPTVFWSRYWNSRVPDARDMYRTRDYEDVYQDLDDNSLDNAENKHQRRYSDLDGYDESLEPVNALRLHSASSVLGGAPLTVILTLVTSFLVLKGFH